MGYRIDYTNGKEEPTKPDIIRKWKWKSYCIAAIVAIGILCSFGKDRIVNWLIPEDASATQGAYESFIDQLKNGRAFDEAIEAFCKEIIDNA